MGLFSKKQPPLSPPDGWPLPTVAEQFVECFHGDPEQRDVRAAAIFHLDPFLAPIEEMQEVADREAAERGDEPTPILEWHLAELEFVDDEESGDRVALFMDHDATAVIRERLACLTLEEARRGAEEWIGTDIERVPFRSLPGLFQTALVTSFGGRELEPSPADFMWVSGYDGSSEAVPVRQFPPEVGKRDQAEWLILPRAAVEELLDSRGW